MILNDRQIKLLGRRGIVKPFEIGLINKVRNNNILSYGTSCFGLDLRLSPNDFRIFTDKSLGIIDVKDFKENHVKKLKKKKDKTGTYFVMPPKTYGLGVAVEYLDIPDDIMVVCVGKSSYARVGIIANITPAEPGWKGYLTLEIFNATPKENKVYANEGIVQLLFLKGDRPNITYSDRKGKYQNQLEQVTLPRL